MDPQTPQSAAPVNPLLAHLNDTDEAHASTRVDFLHPGTIVHPQAKSPHPAMYPPGETRPPEVPVAEKAPEPPKPPPPPPPPVTPPPPIAPPKPKSPRNNRPIVIALIIMLLLALAGGGAYWWFKIRKPTASSTPSTSQSNQAVALTTVAPTNLTQVNSSSQTVAAAASVKVPMELNFTIVTKATTGTATPQVEVQPLGTAFTGKPTYTGTALNANGGSLAAKVAVTDLKDGSYHWQARMMVGSDNSDWVAFAAAGVTTADFVVDSTAPKAPAVTTVGSQSIKAGVTALTTTANPTTIAGTAEPGDAIAVAIAPDNLTATATADVSGHWSITISTALANGAHTVSITSSDAAGNTASTSFTINANTAAAAPATQTVAATGDSTRNYSLLGLALILVSAGGLVLVARHGQTEV